MRPVAKSVWTFVVIIIIIIIIIGCCDSSDLQRLPKRLDTDEAL